jgi:hypothetical protein
MEMQHPVSFHDMKDFFIFSLTLFYRVHKRNILKGFIQGPLNSSWMAAVRRYYADGDGDYYAKL